MKPFIIVIRAIGTEFANRIYLPVVLLAAGICVSLVVLVGWLTTLSSWWWLLAIPLVILISVAIGIAIIVQLIIRFVRPSQTKAQRQAVKQYVDKLQRLAEVAGTPKYILLLNVVRDIVAPSKESYIHTLSNDTKSIKKDFQALQQSFS